MEIAKFLFWCCSVYFYLSHSAHFICCFGVSVGKIVYIFGPVTMSHRFSIHWLYADGLSQLQQNSPLNICANASPSSILFVISFRISFLFCCRLCCVLFSLYFRNDCASCCLVFIRIWSGLCCCYCHCHIIILIIISIISLLEPYAVRYLQFSRFKCNNCCFASSSPFVRRNGIRKEKSAHYKKEHTMEEKAAFVGIKAMSTSTKKKWNRAQKSSKTNPIKATKMREKTA